LPRKPGNDTVNHPGHYTFGKHREIYIPRRPQGEFCRGPEKSRLVSEPADRKGGNETMNTCILKHFAPETMKKILKKMVFVYSMADLCELEKMKKVPACIILFIKALQYDAEIGSLNTLNSILDFIENEEK
jgi:hypothetical protein